MLNFKLNQTFRFDLIGLNGLNGLHGFHFNPEVCLENDQTYQRLGIKLTAPLRPHAYYVS